MNSSAYERKANRFGPFDKSEILLDTAKAVSISLLVLLGIREASTRSGNFVARAKNIPTPTTEVVHSAVNFQGSILNAALARASNIDNQRIFEQKPVSYIYGVLVCSSAVNKETATTSSPNIFANLSHQYIINNPLISLGSNGDKLYGILVHGYTFFIDPMNLNAAPITKGLSSCNLESSISPGHSTGTIAEAVVAGNAGTKVGGMDPVTKKAIENSNGTTTQIGVKVNNYSS